MSEVEQNTPQPSALRAITNQRVATWSEQLTQVRQKIAEFQATALQLEGAIQAAQVFVQDIDAQDIVIPETETSTE